MICKKCGATIGNGAAFCTTCGATISNIARPKTRKEAIKAGQLRNNGRPPVPPITLTAKLVSVFVELILFLFVILVMTTVVNNKFSPENMAASYFVKLVNGDYKAAYKMLDLEEDAFINRDTFAAYVKQFNFEKVEDYSIEQPGSSGSDERTNANVEVSYWNEGEADALHYYVQMVKTEGKKLLLFDDWTVAPSAVVASDCTFVVCDGAQLKIDGVVVDPAVYLVPEEGGYYDNYRIPQMFMGSHALEISMDGMETIKTNIWLNSSGNYNEYTYMNCTEETAKEIQTVAVNNIYRIYDAAVKGSSFDTIASLFVGDAESLAYIAENYSYLVDNLHESMQVDSVTFNNIVARGNTSSTYVEVSFDYVLSGKIQDWWSGNWEPDTYQSSNYCSFNFVKEDGQWKQTDLGCGYLY